MISPPPSPPCLFLLLVMFRLVSFFCFFFFFFFLPFSRGAEELVRARFTLFIFGGGGGREGAERRALFHLFGSRYENFGAAIARTACMSGGIVRRPSSVPSQI